MIRRREETAGEIIRKALRERITGLKKQEKGNSMETQSNARALYTREELGEKVKVPAIVEQDLKRIISDRLEQCGMYFRVFSRIKTPASMERKFEAKEYNNERKLQDLVGVRINLYFDDDVDLCQSIMAQTFEAVEWSASERAEDEFKPTKLNGVFRLPEYLKAEISPVTWDMCIDDTFEVQIKTMFFEGWHEIEHDMRYKGEELWDQYPAFSRYFNSILATLELCDKSIVTLFEDLGHDLYKKGKWTDMIRSHFRIKLADTPIYPEVEERLNEDRKQNVDSIAKRIYKTSKATLAEQMLKRVRRIPINVNTVIALLNESEFHDPVLTQIFRERDVYNDGRMEGLSDQKDYRPKMLSRQTVFQMRSMVDGSRLRDVSGEPDVDMIFDRASRAMYNWLLTKYGDLFMGMPFQPENINLEVMGYRVRIMFDRKSRFMKLSLMHIDLEVAGRVWYSDGELFCEDSQIWFYVNNGFAQPSPEHETEQTQIGGMYFSYPGYYKGVVDNVGLKNGVECQNRRRILRDDQVDMLEGAIRDADRLFPIVLIVSKENEEGMMDEGWLDQFRVSDFTRTVWRYAHVFTTYEKTGRTLLSRMEREASEDDVPALYIFWPDGDIDVYRPEDVDNCSFGRHLEARGDARTYDIVHGGQAFYHKMVTDLRDYNVSMKISG